MKEIFYYLGIMCFGYVLGTFLCFVYKWMKLGFELVNDYEEPEKPVYTQQHYEFIQNVTGEKSLFDKVNDIVKNEKLFIVDDEGKKENINLSYASGSDLVFKLPVNYKYAIKRFGFGKHLPDFNKAMLEADKELQNTCRKVLKPPRQTPRRDTNTYL